MLTPEKENMACHGTEAPCHPKGKRNPSACPEFQIRRHYERLALAAWYFRSFIGGLALGLAIGLAVIAVLAIGTAI